MCIRDRSAAAPIEDLGDKRFRVSARLPIEDVGELYGLEFCLLYTSDAADDLLQHVFDTGQAGYRAVFVDQ